MSSTPRTARAAAPSWPFEPNVYLAIDETGQVTIVAHRSEMGTGIKTDLPPDRCRRTRSRLEPREGGPGRGDDLRYGDQNTDGSRSYMAVLPGHARSGGAAARQMLEAAAAATWHVPAGECRAENGVVVHATTGRRLSFGELVSAASARPVPARDKLRLKDPKDWRYIGKPMPVVDLKDMYAARPFMVSTSCCRA